MIKRSDSTAKESSAKPSHLSSPVTVLSDSIADDNAKRRRHGGILEAIHRWSARNGKSVVIVACLTLLSVFLIPPLKIGLRQHSHSTKQKLEKKQPLPEIPSCDKSPWKENEDLRGKCPGDLKPFPTATTISECATTCCQNDDCISWQFRSDTGCLQGKDVRLGMEKDGVAAWCSDHPPQRWQGQYLFPHKSVKRDAQDTRTKEEIRNDGCNEQKWNPNEQIGQCFGLGDVKPNASGSALECMKACCADEKCGAWQYNKLLGCFYSKGMHGCQGDDGDPVKFEPFVGRRKFRKERTYTDKRGKLWQQTLE